MAEGNFGGGRRIGSVKAAINMYGQSTLRTSSDLKKPLLDFVESSSSVVTDLHKSRRELGIYRESRRAAESAKAEAESELSSVKKTVKELTLLIEESNGKAKLQKRDVEALKKSRMQKEEVWLGGTNNETVDYVEVMRELKAVKQELSKRKLDIASVLEERSRAEKETEDLGLKMEMNLRSVECLKKEIEMANEEQVLVELARIEALKEYKEIEEQREKRGEEFLVSLEEREQKIKEMMEEVEESKETENELSVTLSDVEMLGTQLKLVKEMERRIQGNDSLSRSRGAYEREEDNLSVLKEITEEIEARKKELASIGAEVFQFMTSMDVLRKELIQAKEEIVRFNKVGEKADLRIQRLKSKLLRAKSKLESISAAEKSAKSLAANLTSSLDKLKCDKEAAKKEEVVVKEETTVIKAEIQKTELEIDERERKLLSKLNELEKVKNAEALALEKLESLIENTVESRASVSRQSSTITISRFEYEYLTGHAFHAKEIADKKVAAAEAWVEALKGSTRLILMKAEALKRESGMTKIEEEREAFRMLRSLSAKRVVEREVQRYKQNPETESYLSGKPMRKSTKASGKFTPTQQGKLRKYSPATRVTPTYFIIKKRRKVPNLVKIFRRKR